MHVTIQIGELYKRLGLDGVDRLVIEDEGKIIWDSVCPCADPACTEK
jgi:hypothetical protein